MSSLLLIEGKKAHSLAVDLTVNGRLKQGHSDAGLQKSIGVGRYLRRTWIGDVPGRDPLIVGEGGVNWKRGGAPPSLPGNRPIQIMVGQGTEMKRQEV